MKLTDYGYCYSISWSIKDQLKTNYLNIPKAQIKCHADLIALLPPVPNVIHMNIMEVRNGRYIRYIFDYEYYLETGRSSSKLRIENGQRVWSIRKL